MTKSVHKPAPCRSVREEVRQMREAGRRIAASKTAARRFLASIGMHQKDGRLKPQFR